MEIHTPYRGKRSPALWATFVIYKNLPKVNNHSTGGNSPNLATLPTNANKNVVFKQNCDAEVVFRTHFKLGTNLFNLPRPFFS
jgi:hypothetical protein